jgi:hypothetical protein
MTKPCRSFEPLQICYGEEKMPLSRAVQEVSRCFGFPFVTVGR